MSATYADDFPINDAAPVYARRSLVIAAKELSLRGLDNAASWALDLANCTESPSPTPSQSNTRHAPSWFEERDSHTSQRGHHSDHTSHQDGEASVSWPPYGASSTPARANVMLPPMQSTPFLGSQSNAQVMVSAPSSSSLHTTSSSPQRPGMHSSSMLGVETSPRREDTSLSGRFPGPFRQPPSPLQNISYSADDPIRRGSGSLGDPHGMFNADQSADDSMLHAGGEGGEGVSSQEAHSAHVRFASEAGSSVSNVAGRGASPLHIDVSDDAEYAAYHLGLTYFRTGQLDRCVWALENSKADSKRRARKESEANIFLRNYVKMLIVERNSASSSAEFAGSDPARKASILRSSLIPLLKDLIDPSEPFLLFLKGLLLRKLRKRIEAMDCFIRSLISFPYNWTVWMELSCIIDASAGELEEIVPLLPHSFMTLFFLEHHGRQSTAGRDPELNTERASRLLNIFPDNAGLWNTVGAARYLQQDFGGAIEAFEKAIEIDPFRVDGLADYSNALFLLACSEKLAHLAHTASQWGSESAEVCCVVGNHFYFQSDHSRAIEAFKRAIKLDPGCQAAHILLGHTFVEMKNSGAAAEMYRRAIDINPRDYRPWHGLGKVYELLEAYTFAVHYYLKAAGIAPYTPTVWESLALTYQKLYRDRDAISAYQRQVSCEQDIDIQLSSIKNIIMLLDSLIASAVAEAATDGEGEGDNAARAKVDLRSRVGELTDEATDWHRRAVALLLHQHRQNVQQQEGAGSDGADGTRGQDADAARQPPKEDGAASAASMEVNDLKMWAESFVRAAKAEAGLPWDFDPDQAARGGHEPHDGSEAGYDASGGAGAMEVDDASGRRRFKLENTALASEYLSRVLLLANEVGTGTGAGEGTAGADHPGSETETGSVARWVAEAEKLRRWLSGVKE